MTDRYRNPVRPPNAGSIVAKDPVSEREVEEYAITIDIMRAFGQKIDAYERHPPKNAAERRDFEKAKIGYAKGKERMGAFKRRMGNATGIGTDLKHLTVVRDKDGHPSVRVDLNSLPHNERLRLEKNRRREKRAREVEASHAAARARKAAK